MGDFVLPIVEKAENEGRKPDPLNGLYQQGIDLFRPSYLASDTIRDVTSNLINTGALAPSGFDRIWQKIHHFVENPPRLLSQYPFMDEGDILDNVIRAERHILNEIAQGLYSPPSSNKPHARSEFNACSLHWLRDNVQGGLEFYNDAQSVIAIVRRIGDEVRGGAFSIQESLENIKNSAQTLRTTAHLPDYNPL